MKGVGSTPKRRERKKKTRLENCLNRTTCVSRLPKIFNSVHRRHDINLRLVDIDRHTSRRINVRGWLSLDIHYGRIFTYFYTRQVSNRYRRVPSDERLDDVLINVHVNQAARVPHTHTVDIVRACVFYTPTRGVVFRVPRKLWSFKYFNYCG